MVFLSSSFFAVKARSAEEAGGVECNPSGRWGREVRREIRERSDRVPKLSGEPAAQPLARSENDQMMPKASRQNASAAGAG
jgi:hypothetical protein